jgi:hypothetical protein
LEDASDNNIFIISVVPLQLYSPKTSGDKLYLWQNPRPSVSYCYFIRIQFEKEITELAKEETSGFEERIKNLEENGENFGGIK